MDSERHPARWFLQIMNSHKCALGLAICFRSIKWLLERIPLFVMFFPMNSYVAETRLRPFRSGPWMSQAQNLVPLLPRASIESPTNGFHGIPTPALLQRSNAPP